VKLTNPPVIRTIPVWKGSAPPL